MKAIRITAFLLITAAALGLFAGCKVQTAQKDERPYIVCTVFPAYDFVKKIVGEGMRVELLVPAGSETHAFAVKDIGASHLNDLLDADLIVHTGGESDEKLIGELEKFLSQKKTGVQFTDLLSLIAEPLYERETMGMHVQEEEGEEEHEHEHETGEEGDGEVDEHVWTSPRRALEIVKNLTPVLEKIAAAHGVDGSGYAGNAQAFSKKLEALDRMLTEVVFRKKYDTLIFADRFPFRYLCHDYGISADAAFQGCSTSIEPAAATLDYLYREAQRLGLPAILYMEGSKPMYAEKLAKDLGVQALMLHSCHIISTKDFENEDYLSLMEKNVKVLMTALGAQ